MNLPFLCLLLSAISVFSTQARERDLILETQSEECRAWVDSVYDALSERDRVAQLLCPKVNPAGGEASRAAIKKYVGTCHVGGLLFSEGSAKEYAEMTNYAQSLARVPVLMTFDGEWGLAMRIKTAPRFPHNMALGAIQDENLLYDYGREMARECRLMGVHVNFAPDADVNSNPANPVIGFRSFGEDPERVGALASAYARGLEDGGVQAVAKHFPGHGDTDVDSHKGLPTVAHSAERFDSIDLVPFRQFIKDGGSGIMVGHLDVPVFDPSGAPASLSHKITTGLLKDKMRFRGLVYTDALEMKGARVEGKNTCVAAIEAGAEMLLSGRNPAADIDAILAAVKAGKIKPAAIEAACRKVLAYKYVLIGPKAARIDLNRLSARIASPEAEAVISRLADASATALRNNGNILPLGDIATRKIAVVNIGSGTATAEFTAMCRKYAAVDIFDASAGIPSRIKDYDVVIAAVFTDSQASRQALARLDGCRALVDVFFINPYKMAKFRASLPRAAAIVTVYDDLAATGRAAAKAIFGGIKTDGRLPVALRGIAPMGAGIDLPKTRLGYSTPAAQGMRPSLTDSIDAIVGRAMAAGAFPGAQVLVARGGDIVVDRNYGHTTKGGPKVDGSTVYDLASVSKAIGTLPGVMKAYDLGLFSLDAPASRIIPGLRVEGKADITPRQLLHHETGMPPSLDMYDLLFDPASYTGKLTTRRRDKAHTIKIQNRLWGNTAARLRPDLVSATKKPGFDIEAAAHRYVGAATLDTIMGRIYNAPLRSTRNYLYSCLNFCLLMDMEQRLTGRPHDRWVADSIWTPAEATGLCYRPLSRHAPSKIAPTERDTYLRRQTVHGHVHDELAAFSGGVQGNAGVFGSATDIARICQMWLNGGEYAGRRILSPETTRLFTTEKSPTCRRGLGFDKPDADPDNSPTCDEADLSAYGHLGFTGTVFWVDPANDLIFVFLTNRVNPTRDNAAFSRANVRPELFRQVYLSLQ